MINQREDIIGFKTVVTLFFFIKYVSTVKSDINQYIDHKWNTIDVFKVDNFEFVQKQVNKNVSDAISFWKKKLWL